ncbi:MAG: metalloregulator ArsR/SmtB family transcription factor [bacterium]
MVRTPTNPRQASRFRTAGMRRTPDACAEAMKALSDPNRIRIVRALLVGPANVTEIAARAGLSVHRVSHHLGRMRPAGLVACTRRGRQMIYRIAEAVGTADGLDLGFCHVQFRPTEPDPK